MAPKPLPIRDQLLGAHVSVAGGVHLAPERGAKIGASAIQIFVKNNNRWEGPPISDDDARAFKANMRRYGIRRAFAHTAYLINLAAPDSRVYLKSLAAMKDEMNRCAQLGVPWIVMHPGSPKERTAKWGIDRIAAALNRLFDESPGQRVRVLLETTAGQGSSLGRTFEELAEILERIDDKKRIGVCMDTCHIFAAGYDIHTPEGWSKTMASFSKTIGFRRLYAVHVNDSLKPYGSHRDRHAHIGKGEIGRGAFQRLMNDKRFQKIPKVLETPKGDDEVTDDIQNLNRLKRMAAK